jgi:hypothetical protein
MVCKAVKITGCGRLHYSRTPNLRLSVRAREDGSKESFDVPGPLQLTKLTNAVCAGQHV